MEAVNKIVAETEQYRHVDLLCRQVNHHRPLNNFKLLGKKFAL